MLAQITKALVGVAVSSALTLALGQAQGQQAQPAPQGQAAGQQATQPAQAAGPQWKDRAEYDLVQQIGQTTDGAKKLALLEQWTQKYPNTEFKVARMVQYLEAHRLLNQRDKMLDMARQILAVEPNNLTALYWTAIVVPMGNLSPENMQFGQTAAQKLTGNLDELKPANVADAEWQKTKEAMKLGAVGHRALGFIAMSNKDFPTAEKELRANLESNPADAEAAYWLGTSILGQKVAERQSEALFYFARAAAYDGPGSLDANRRKQLLDYVTKAYNTYHGVDAQGLQELLALARQNPAPPAGFKILSETEVKEAHIKTLPASVAFWVKLKEALAADPSYFETGMKGALIPPEGQPALTGRVISATPAKAPKEVVVAVQDPNTPEITLKVVDTALPGPAEPGTEITFRGVADAFQATPFMVTFNVERKNIEGWPTPAPAPKKAGGKKKK